MAADKVGISACTGMGKALGTVSRQAMYKAIDALGEENVALICFPALCAGVEEDVEFVKKYPIIIIDGCAKKCAEKVIRKMGGNIAAKVFIPDVLKHHPELKPESRVELGPKGKLLVDFVADAVVQEAKSILECKKK
jgi:uncharacterized metal-binding protein